MKNIIIKNGLIAGSITGLVTLVSAILHTQSSATTPVLFTYGMYLGYAGMLAAFAFIFLGVRQYKLENSQLSFGKALALGLGIMVVACAVYALVWMLVLKFIIPNFMTEYGAYALQNAQKTGKSAAEIASLEADIASMNGLYKNPLSAFFITMLEPTPVGILVSLVSALVHRKKTPSL